MEGDNSASSPYIPVCQTITEGGERSWALFENGTLVLLQQDALGKDKDVREVATELMKQYGPVYPGSDAGDFRVCTSF